MFRLRLTVCAVVGLFLFSLIGAGPVPTQRAAAGIGTTVYLPNVTKKLGGEDGWQTPFIVQNVGSDPTNVTMDFFAFSDGSLVKTRTVSSLAPSNSVFHDPNSDPDLPAGGQFSVVIRSTNSPVVSVVNEHQNVRNQQRQEALSYQGLSEGSTKTYAPYFAHYARRPKSRDPRDDREPSVRELRRNAEAAPDPGSPARSRAVRRSADRAVARGGHRILRESRGDPADRRHRQRAQRRSVRKRADGLQLQRSSRDERGLHFHAVRREEQRRHRTVDTTLRSERRNGRPHADPGLSPRRSGRIPNTHKPCRIGARWYVVGRHGDGRVDTRRGLRDLHARRSVRHRCRHDKPSDRDGLDRHRWLSHKMVSPEHNPNARWLQRVDDPVLDPGGRVLGHDRKGVVVSLQRWCPRHPADCYRSHGRLQRSRGSAFGSGSRGQHPVRRRGRGARGRRRGRGHGAELPGR